ncbi:MAG: DUF1015 domain-containing protein [Planctomycetaceae bacterium]|jgi:uncharacterized protein (DUF1015 family)|nr:DUF1015 domain-containing protein [Planctomycetaceae bacterium]
MPEITPFAALRYDTEKVNLADVIAPPYDVIDPDFQRLLYRRHPNNVVRLILDKMSPSDSADDNRYTRSAKTLADWKQSGILIRDAKPAIYVYHQVCTVLGVEYVRRGFMCRCKAIPFGEGLVFPHEQTMSGPKMDRLMLTTACKTNFSQVFGLYPDAANSTQKLLDDAVAAAGLKVYDAIDHLGTTHRMWILTDENIVERVCNDMESRPMFIADGHHRYETACNYRKQIAKTGELTPEHPANYVLMFCIAMDDPGLLVLPTHRLFRGLPQLTQPELIAKLGDAFSCIDVGGGRTNAGKIWAELEKQKTQNRIALYTKEDDKWTVVMPTQKGESMMNTLAAEHHPEWRALGVSILHRLIVETILGQKYDLKDDSTKPKYVHLIQEVIDELKNNEYQLAALVMPATVEHIRTLSLLGDRMPAKSTYFFPKLISGFVFNPLE